MPVILGTIPYGFAGKHQGIQGSLDQPAELAESLVKTLLANPQARGEMKRSLVKAFSRATSFNMAIALRWLVVEVTDFTDDEKELLRKACVENDQVAGAWNVAKAIYSAFGKPTDLKKIQRADVLF
jgi:hypothetical protein